MDNKQLEEIMMRADIEYDYLKDTVHSQYEEINRLNNIINKLEDFIRDQYRSQPEQDIEWEVALILDKLIELKGEK